MSTEFVIGLGANLGSREACLRAAVELLSATTGCAVRALSSVFETEAVGPVQPRYLNAAVRVVAALDPESLLGRLQEIERLLGRERTKRWEARTIDLDILWSEAGRVETPRIVVPHPRLEERAFALAPLLEVAPALKPLYAPILAALGGTPIRVGPLSQEPAAEASDRGNRRCLEIRARDRADALAAAATVFARRVWAASPDSGPPEARQVLEKCRPGDECRAYLLGITREAANGFITRQALISRLGPGEVCGRLVGHLSTEPVETADAVVSTPAGRGELSIKSRSAGFDVVAFFSDITEG